MLGFLLLRRRVDPVLLSLGMALFTIRLGLEIAILGFLAAVGIYLIGCRHRSMRYIDRTYAIFAGIYAAGAVVIGLIHGNLLVEMRWIGYPVYLLVGVLFFPGFILIKDPLRQVTLGARAGLLLAFSIGAADLLTGTARVGYGGNAASAAIVLVVVGVLARIHVREPVRFLPNSRLWFYLAAACVVMTGTRSVLPVFIISILLDLLAIRRALMKDGMQLPLKVTAVTALVALTSMGAIGHEVSRSVTLGVDRTVKELKHLFAEDADGRRRTGLSMRFQMWENAAEDIGEHLVIGSGGAESMREVVQAIPENERSAFGSFVHVHNFVLDEIRTRGIIGLVLMLCFFAATAGKLMKWGNTDIREATLLFLATLLLYGSMHGLLVADRNMILFAIFLSTLLLQIKKKTLWNRVES